MNWVIVVAGGNGKRMWHKENKIFVRIARRPILYWTVKAFEQCKLIDRIVVSARHADIPAVRQCVRRYRISKVFFVLDAAETRQKSIFETLEWLSQYAQSDDIVGVHNAVNPFVQQQELVDVYNAARQDGAALLAQPARDTVKVSDDQMSVDHTPLRQRCWYAQTPQVALYEHLQRAAERAQRDHFEATDDAQVLERIGIKPRIVPCSNTNIKITYPEDLIYAREVIKTFSHLYD